MDKNKKILLKIFDIDDDLVDDISFDTDTYRNILYVKFKRTINYCPVCGSVKLLSKGYYTSELIGCPFNYKMKKPLIDKGFVDYMGRPMRIELTNAGATIRCVNHFATVAITLIGKTNYIGY